jgi:hypothetical protein
MPTSCGCRLLRRPLAPTAALQHHHPRWCRCSAEHKTIPGGATSHGEKFPAAADALSTVVVDSSDTC